MTTRFRRHVLAERRAQRARTLGRLFACVGAGFAAFSLALLVTGAAPSTMERAAARPLHARIEIEPARPLAPDVDFNRFGEVWRGPTDRKVIALTFDDGPYPFYTPLLLHVLERSNVRATFFIVGRNAQEFPELVSRIVAAGDEVGNHTFNHYKLTYLSAEQIQRQIVECNAVLEPFIGHPLTLFRPPHGRYDRRVVSIAHDLGYHTIFWSDSPEDTKDIAPSLVVHRVLAEAAPGAIVLMHSGQYKTVVALPVIIDRLRARGYTFVTVGEMLSDPE